MDFFERNYYPNTGKNISGFLNHLKISIDKNKNTKNIEIIKIIFPSFLVLNAFGLMIHSIIVFYLDNVRSC